MTEQAPAATLDVAVQRRVGAFSLTAEFTAEPGITVLFGESGSGKSMTLRCISGLTRPDSGRVALDGVPVFSSGDRIDVPPHRRGIGVVLQTNALFPHLCVAGNIEFGLVGMPRTARRARVDALLALLDLEGYAERKPRSLSGGQQQRVALARALAPNNRVLLLDEPFSALDESLRSALRLELLRLRSEFGLTILFVTHDLREAHLLADRLAVIDGGRFLQLGAREEVFKTPVNRRVAELTGVANVFPGRVVALAEGALVVEAAGARLRCASYQPGAAVGDEVDVCIRAERVNLRRGAEGVENTIAATICEEFAYGPTHTLQFGPTGPGPALEVEIAARPYDVMHVASQRSWILDLPAADLHVMRR